MRSTFAEKIIHFKFSKGFTGQFSNNKIFLTFKGIVKILSPFTLKIIFENIVYYLLFYAYLTNDVPSFNQQEASVSN